MFLKEILKEAGSLLYFLLFICLPNKYFINNSKLELVSKDTELNNT